MFNKCLMKELMDVLFFKMFVKVNGIKVFENGMRIERFYCYKDINDLILVFLKVYFFVERIFNWEMYRKDFGSVRGDLVGF